MTTAMARIADQKKLLDSADHRLNNLAVKHNINYHQTSTDDQEDDIFEEASNGCRNEFPEDQSANHLNGMKEAIKCSAVHTLERDMPDFDYSHLVTELRNKILNDCQENEGVYSQSDIDKCKQDDWFLSRFLLRQKLDVDAAFLMLKKAMRFHHESLINSIRREDFPAEFYKVGGLFQYEPDRKGNKTLYIRVKHHRKVPEIQLVLHAFLYYNIRCCDEEANGRGICMVFDCTGGGLASADMDTLFFLASTLFNYFPKGLSYLLVHNLPWILKPFWHIAKTWVPQEYKQLIQFSNSQTIYEYIDKENLPDFMGGTCKRDYRAAPENCTTLEQAAKLWGIEGHVARRMLEKFAEFLPPESVQQAEEVVSKLMQTDEGNYVDATEENDSDQENRPKMDL